ncbi:WYL domain-containing protein [Lentimicrobium sp. L6]|uniref:helix-turn-helix transcriptional regulator n=1 Tax=Lentimicrobium sp. L6 TaxID=2735916 RepID=UPI001551C4EE|nr:WYL domain-containing protein [Lentimicrobium sp. L6]NPD83854.1 WYL domain-containing protein [Lentimicrobium sp. L6]
MKNNQDYNHILRIGIIYDLLKKKDFTKRNEFENVLLEKLGHFSSRTFDRDLRKLREQFGLVIRYENPYGYGFDKAYEQDTSKIENLLHLMNSTVFKMNHLNKKDIIYPFTSNNIEVNEFLPEISEAISSCHKIHIAYRGYWETDRKEYILSPYLLKEFQLRWYVLSKVDGEIRVFGLDRIRSIDVLQDESVERPKIDASVFNNIIGVSEPHLKPEKVVLAFTPRQGRYIKSSPIHPTQELVSDDENGLVISLKVGINWELKEVIKKNGIQVKVLEPAHLVEEIKQELIDNLKQYQS